VYVKVASVDDEKRFVAGIGITVMLAHGVTGRRLNDAAGPFRDGAFGVSGPFSPQRG